MLFNSIWFIAVFLPLSCLFFSCFRSKSLSLLLISLAFYWISQDIWILFLVGSSLANYGLITLYAKTGKSVYIYSGLLLDLVHLSVWKTEYALCGFLPWGISFYAFQQIAVLFDVLSGKVKRMKPLDYLLFISFFPQLIAGPISRWRELAPEFSRASEGSVAARLWPSFAFFTFGLFKKAIIADRMGVFADAVFNSPGIELSTVEAWFGALAYTFQIYFDFSGYCDMAAGIAYLFNVRLPINFDSPYKSYSIVEFWRRWHITLSNFFKDYIYIALGGNRFGGFRQAVNILIVWAFCGLWHGFQSTFLCWGMLHALLIIATHKYVAVISGKGNLILRYVEISVTFVVTILLWSLFRAESLTQFGDVLSSMFSFDFFPLFPNALANWREFVSVAACILPLVFFFPNAHELMRRYPLSHYYGSDVKTRSIINIAWDDRFVFMLISSCMFIVSLVYSLDEVVFLYFSF